MMRVDWSISRPRWFALVAALSAGRDTRRSDSAYRPTSQPIAIALISSISRNSASICTSWHLSPRLVLSPRPKLITVLSISDVPTRALSEHFQNSFRAFSEHFQSSFFKISFRAVLEHFQSSFFKISFRAILEQFQSSFFKISFRAVSEQFQSSLRAVLEQFQSSFFQISFRAVSEQFQSSFRAVSATDWSIEHFSCPNLSEFRGF